MNHTRTGVIPADMNDVALQIAADCAQSDNLRLVFLVLLNKLWVQKAIKLKWFVIQEGYRNKESLGTALR
jgi:hypothetical protein